MPHTQVSLLIIIKSLFLQLLYYDPGFGFSMLQIVLVNYTQKHSKETLKMFICMFHSIFIGHHTIVQYDTWFS